MDALRAFWRWEGHDRMPAVLVSTVEWLDEDGRHEADRRVLAELAERGLLAGGTVPKQVRATFHTVTRPEFEVFGWISTPQRTVGVLAAAGGGEGVLVVREGDTAQVSPVRPDDVAEVVVAQLPAVQPAHGRSVNVSEADFRGTPAADSEEGFAGFGNHTESPDTRALKALLNQPLLGISQFWTSARGADGRLRRADTPITVRDTPDGRWLTQTKTASGRRWVIATPAGPQLVTSKLHEVLRGLG